MFDNVSALSPSPTLSHVSNVEHLSYIVLGSLLTTANLLIFSAIVIHKALRDHKEYTLLGLLVFFNSLMGMGILSAGIYRLSIGDEITRIITQRDCMRLPHCLLLAGSACVVSILLPFIALDRLIAITRPLFYHAFYNTYPRAVALFCLSFYSFSSIFAIFHPLYENKGVAARCDTRDVFSHTYKHFESACIALSHMAAVSIYTVVIIAFHCNTKAPTVRRDSRSCVSVSRRQIRVIRTFSIFAILTFCVVVVPYFFVFVSNLVTPEDSPYRSAIDSFYLIVTKIAILNPTLNVVIYALRHNEIYVGVRSLLARQQMPPSTDEWCVTKKCSISRSLSCQETPPKFKYSLAHYKMVKNCERQNGYL